MTEDEWLSGTDQYTVLQGVRRLPVMVSDRRLRLFAVACVRHAKEPFADPELRDAVELVERFADARTNADRQAIKAARRIAKADFPANATWRDGNLYDDVRSIYYLLDPLVRRDALLAADDTARRCIIYDRAVGRDGTVGRRVRMALFRDIVGIPFRPTRLRSRWLTPTARDLANVIYADRAFDRLPILADALEEAGCDNADVLAHCRGGGPHVRGCWAVDLVLGKS